MTAILKQFQALANIAAASECHVDETMRQAIHAIALEGLAASPEFLERYKALRETRTTAQALDMLAADEERAQQGERFWAFASMSAVVGLFLIIYAAIISFGWLR